MYYRDLTPYRDGGTDEPGTFNVYPGVLNIGWLDGKHPFETGTVPAPLLGKLRHLTLSDAVNRESQRAGTFDAASALIVHQMHVRGSPHECPFCGHAIALDPQDTDRPRISDRFFLGTSEICIPAAAPTPIFYSFPSLLLHYISAHRYLPPAEFLEALEQFDTDRPFDIEAAMNDVEFEVVSAAQLQSIDEGRSKLSAR
jgi:hypothetical protein